MIPGKPTNVKVFGTFPFLLLACVMPLVDFVSDIATAGRRSTIFTYRKKCRKKFFVPSGGRKFNRSHGKLGLSELRQILFG